ncbi:alpha/beta fold hydrolase [Melittangium boletus]|uniref:Alpha/beta hydrolase n=1 Tax=Melittangium boletus DSM 14713 TaxID=1294270 RepID=A0A250IMB5_9BACT|nr:alpha/beta hydrolase [Melittangium boletus]ATB32895.1 alpha/beta hydrolase [Melittangium boletus DSM 14713]
MTLRFPAPDRTRQLDLEDGRRLGWSEWGDVHGTPVLFCTGAGMTRSFGFGADALRELSVRLICIDRPGLGGSAPDPDKSLASYARDVVSVLRCEGIVRPAVVGFSQGAPFAVAVAGMNTVSALALVSGQDELAYPPTRRMLHPDVAGLVAAIEADREGFEASFAARVDARGLWSLIIGMSAPEDRVLYNEPAFAAAYQQSLAEGFAQGPGGYVRDLTLAMSRWSTRPEAISVPVSLWYGQRDTSPVHSPDFGATLSSRFPNARLHVLPDEGGSLLWTRSRDILRELVRAS